MIRVTTRLACALAPAAFASAFAAALPDPVPIRLIGINDFHGSLETANLTLSLADPAAAPGAPRLNVAVGGAAALAGMVQRLRAGSRYSFMLAGGDLVGAAPLVSSLFRHESTIEVLNDIGLEASSFGNHEFDAGFGELTRLMNGGCAENAPANPAASCVRTPYRGARFRYLGANVLDAAGKPVAAPYVIKRFAGIPVGIIGAVTRTTPQLVTPSGIAGLRFIDEAEGVNRAAEELRAKGVRAMVAVFHEGLELGTEGKRGDWNDTTCPQAHGPLLDIARRLAPEIRVVFSGHSHMGYRCEVDGRLLIQGTSHGRGISVVDVELDRATGAMLPPVRSINLPLVNAKTSPEQRERIAAATPEPFAAVLREARPDIAIGEKVAAYAKLAAPKAQRQVATIGGTFTRGPALDSRGDRVDSAAGRLIADAQLAATRGLGAQVAFMNPAGIRTALACAGSPPCPVTYGDLFVMQPFGNSLVVMTLTGRELRALLEAQDLTDDRSVMQPSANFTYTWQTDAPQGERIRDALLDGKPLDPDAAYRVCVNSFMAEGGDGFVLLRNGTERKGGGQDLDALIAYLGAATRIPDPTPRITRLPR
jgi:5'-nucleotidase